MSSCQRPMHRSNMILSMYVVGKTKEISWDFHPCCMLNFTYSRFQNKKLSWCLVNAIDKLQHTWTLSHLKKIKIFWHISPIETIKSTFEIKRINSWNQQINVIKEPIDDWGSDNRERRRSSGHWPPTNGEKQWWFLNDS